MLKIDKRPDKVTVKEIILHEEFTEENSKPKPTGDAISLSKLQQYRIKLVSEGLDEVALDRQLNAEVDEEEEKYERQYAIERAQDLFNRKEFNKQRLLAEKSNMIDELTGVFFLNTLTDTCYQSTVLDESFLREHKDRIREIYYNNIKNLYFKDSSTKALKEVAQTDVLQTLLKDCVKGARSVADRYFAKTDQVMTEKQFNYALNTVSNTIFSDFVLECAPLFNDVKNTITNKLYKESQISKELNILNEAERKRQLLDEAKGLPKKDNPSYVLRLEELSKPTELQQLTRVLTEQVMENVNFSEEVVEHVIEAVTLHHVMKGLKVSNEDFNGFLVRLKRG